MKVLLIWEEIPEDTKFFALEGEIAEAAMQAHGCIVNLVDGDPEQHAAELSDLLMKSKPIDKSKPFNAKDFDHVVWSGFMM